MNNLSVVKRRGKTKDEVIESKDQRWHCRNRITLVFGSNDQEELETYLYTDDTLSFQTINFHQAKSKAVEEILDNCIDEFYRKHVTEIRVTLSEDQTRVTIEDNGIGFPLKNIKQVYTEFRTGSKFKDEDVDKNNFLFRTLGQNGLGAAATCLTSDIFKVRVRHYNSKTEQTFTFSNGALKTSKSKRQEFKGHSGVKVELVLSKEVYKDNVIDKDLLLKRIIDLAYNNPGLIFYFNDKKYIYKKGIEELSTRFSGLISYHLGKDSIVYKTETKKHLDIKGRIDVNCSLVFNFKSDDREKFISFVNSTPTFDGGFHQDKIKRLFIKNIKQKLESKTKKKKITLIDNDILSGIIFLISIIMPNPRFESQTKRKLVRDNHLDKAIEEFYQNNINKFFRKNSEYLELVLERASSRQKFQDLKDASKHSKKQKKIKVEKLLDANERKKRNLCTLFICEGDSAIGGLRSSRNKLYQGGIALRGKPLNVSQSSIKDILKNQEFSDIMTSVGLVIGQQVDFENIRFGNIVFLADSDVDGGHINTLLINFLYTFWPQLFNRGMVQVAKAPLFEVVTSKKTFFIESDLELLEFRKQKIVIKKIYRNKGLGEMSDEAWKYVLAKNSYTKILNSSSQDSSKILEICFGKDTGARKELLLDV